MVANLKYSLHSLYLIEKKEIFKHIFILVYLKNMYILCQKVIKRKRKQKTILTSVSQMFLKKKIEKYVLYIILFLPVCKPSRIHQ